MKENLTPSEIDSLLKELSEQQVPIYRNQEGNIVERSIQTTVTAFGKQKNIFDSELIMTQTYKQYIDRLSNDNNYTVSNIDPFRVLIGSCWANEDGNISYMRNDPKVSLMAPFVYSFDIAQPVEMNESGILPELYESFRITPNQSSPVFQQRNSLDFLNPYRISDRLINRSFSNTIREDHVSSLTLPFDNRYLKKFNTSSNSMFVDIKPTYNFFISAYETGISSDAILEQNLPNMYVMLYEMSKERSESENEWYRNHITLSNTFMTESVKNLMKKIYDNKDDIRYSNSIEYFDVYGRQASLLPSATSEQLSKKFTNLLISNQNIDLLKDLYPKKELFPMYFDIQFSTDKKTEFSQMIKDSGFSSILMNTVASRINSLPEKRFIEYTTNNLQALSDVVRVNENVQIAPPQILNSVRRALDLNEWYQSFIDGRRETPIGFFDSPNSIFIGANDPEQEVVDDPAYDLYRTLMSVVFSSKIRELTKNRTRSYQDILMGKKAQSETVLYRIEKRRGDENGEVIQNFWLPNSNDIDIHKFVDTQVKYGKRYTYIIYAYELIFGTKYYYKNIFNNISNSYVTVVSSPSLKLIEIPIFKYSNRVIDSPPIWPDVEIVPFKSVSDQIKINLSSNIGSYELKPEVIFPSELSIIDEIRKNQDRDDNKIRYESDDHINKFEIFRLDYHPSSYSDFTPSIREVIENTTSYIDNIEPNTKYWYTFRSVDNHGHISYPTPIYQVEIIDDNGSIYPKIEVVELLEEEPKMFAKTMKRLMQIKPVYAQAVINFNKSILNNDAQDTVFLGTRDETLWGKRFKIRLTSKETGRKIDLNIVFEHEFLKNNEN